MKSATAKSFTTFFNKLVSSVSIVAMTVLTVSPAIMAPVSAYAAGALTITCDAVTVNGNIWTFSGTWKAVDFVGQSNQYDSAIFSPLGTLKDGSSKDAPDAFVITQGPSNFEGAANKDDIRGTWSNEVDYSSGSPLAVASTLYHSQVPGNETSGDATCTFVLPSHLTLHKTVVNNNGGSAANTAWTLTATGPTNTSGVDGSVAVTNKVVSAGSYTLSETGGPAGYSASAYSCTKNGGPASAGNTVAIGAGEDVVCTITNDDVPAKLTVTKVVLNDNGGTKVVGDFTLLVGIQSVLSGVQNLFNVGAYTISEQGNGGYTGVITGDCAGNGSVTLALGEVKTCTITNSDIAPSLTLNKVVIDDNDNNGTTPSSAFTITATGPSTVSGVGPSVSSDGTFKAGSYALSESGPAGYVGTWACTGATSFNGTTNTVVIGLGQTVSCTVTNNDVALPVCSNGSDDDIDGFTDIADAGCHTDLDAGNTGSYDPNGASEGNETTLATCTDSLDNDGDSLVDLADPQCAAFTPKLIVEKVLISDNGGPTNKSLFSFDVTNAIGGLSDISFEPDGSNLLTLAPGEYSVAEDTSSAFTTTYSADCSGTIAANETKTCTITNDDKLTTYIVKKVLLNDSGKNSPVISFSFKVDGGSDIVFEADGENEIVVLPGLHTVVENVAPGYETSHVNCTNLFALGSTATCTITNDDIPACSDGLDNDGDEGIDSEDLGCYVEGEGDPVYDPNKQDEGNESTLALCTDGVDNDADEAVDFADSDCAVFMPHLIVKKVVINDNGGEMSASDFYFQVNGGEETPFGEGGETDVVVNPGTYTVTEVSASGYAVQYEGCTNVELEANGTATCTITNDDVSKLQCADGIDNEDSEDSLVDADDPGCHTDNNASNPASYSPSSTTETNGNGGGGGGGFLGGGPLNGGGGLILGASSVGQVLGESCGLFMNQHLRRGSSKNNADQVSKLQEFLNKYGFGTFTPTGYFGPMTEGAVKAFQSKYSSDILTPWGLSTPSGLVYLTTLYKVNLLECPELTLALPPLVPWSQNPNAQ